MSRAPSPPAATLGGCLAHWVEHAPAREALVGPSCRLTYAELADAVAGTATALLRRGIGRGDVVAALTGPDEDFWTLFLAVTSLGAIWLGLNPKHTERERGTILADARPALVLDLRVDSLPIVAPDPDALAAQAAVVMPADPAAIVYTSGSSGRPKGALLPHRGFTFCGAVQAGHWFDTHEPRVLVNLPVSHVGCLGDLASATLVAGGTVVMQPVFDAGEVARLLDSERITTWAAVPTAIELTLGTPSWEAADLGALERVVWSGGAMPRPVAEQLAHAGLPLLNCYGMTETVGNITFTDAGDTLDRLIGTIGRPDPAYQVRLKDGEIQVRGEHVFLGYLNDPAATAAAFDDGWLRTGDLAERRADGALVLIGRTTEAYKSGGYNVYPREVELALEQHPAVLAAAVVAAPHPLWGETGHAFVVTRDAMLDPVAVRESLRDRLAGYKLPAQVHLLDRLPLLDIGKVDKQALRAALTEVPA